MKRPLIVMLVLLVVGTTTFAAADPSNTEETAIAGVFDRLTEAWRAGDGSAWADEFIEDADFTVWFGLRLKGREQIAWGHQMIFDTVYTDTVFDLEVRQIRFVRPDIAVVQLSGSVVRDGDGELTDADAVPIAVLEKSADVWKIVAFQNTPSAVTEMREKSGNIKLFKEFAADLPTISRPKTTEESRR